MPARRAGFGKSLMDSHATLIAFAEISVAFAGFGGLAGILSQRLSGDAAALAAVRLRAVIEWALVVVAFSLLPLVVVDIAPGLGAWQVLSILLAIAAVAHRLWAGRKLRGLAWGGRTYRILTYVWLLGTAAVLVVNGAGLFAPIAAAVYLCGLLSYLIFAMLLFARLLQSLV
jgi:hypothetical protein